jgi:hypothetical protein
MDENDYLSTITNFFQSALNFGGTGGSVPSSGTPAIAAGSGTFDQNSANATTQGTYNYLSGLQGGYNASYAFLNNAFQGTTAFLQPILSDVTSDANSLGTIYANAAQTTANALMKEASKKTFGLFGSSF